METSPHELSPLTLDEALALLGTFKDVDPTSVNTDTDLQSQFPRLQEAAAKVATQVARSGGRFVRTDYTYKLSIRYGANIVGEIREHETPSYISVSADWNESRQRLHNGYVTIPQAYQYLQQAGIRPPEIVSFSFDLNLADPATFDTDDFSNNAHVFTSDIQKLQPDCLVNEGVVYDPRGTRIQDGRACVYETSSGNIIGSRAYNEAAMHISIFSGILLNLAQRIEPSKLPVVRRD